MNVKLTQIILVTALAGLAGCNGGGGSDKPAAVPAAPQRINAMWNNQTDPNNYCDIAVVSGPTQTLTCYSISPNGGQQMCQPSVITFTDTATMCSQLQTTMISCGMQAAQRVYQERCSTVNPSPFDPGMPSLPMPTDPNMKLFQCEFEARRVVVGQKWVVRYERNYGTPKIITQVIVDGTIRQEIDLRNKFLGFDIGSFGTTKMVFTPANQTKNTSDTITLTNAGLNGSMYLLQSGFAGQEVKLNAQNDDGTIKYSVSCVGKSAFKKSLVTKPYRNFVCRGTSNLGSRTEKIEFSAPYNSQLLKETQLANGLTMDVSGDTGGRDNARISIRASAAGSDISTLSSAYLKSPTQFRMSDSYSSVDVTCYPTF